MKRSIKISVALLLVGGAMQAVNEFRTPLSFRNDGSFHHWLGTVQSATWYNNTNIPCLRECSEDPCEDKSRLQANIFSGAYYRSADKAFFNTEKNKNTRKTTGLSSLFFGKESFRGEEIFVDGIVKNPVGADTTNEVLVNPLLGAARITPNFDYNEKGVFLGGRIDYTFGCENVWHVGGRASVPFKVIEIEHDSCARLEETLDDLVKFRNINFGPSAVPVQNEYAIRLDFLNSLVYRFILTNTNEVNPMIEFPVVGNQSTLSVFDLPTSGPIAADAAIRAYVVKSDNGECPTKPFRKLDTQAISALSASGSGADGQAYFFQNGVDYQNNLFCDRDAQGMLFLVPRAALVGVGPGTSLDTANGADTLANALLDRLANEEFASADLEPVSEFFRTRGIDLGAHERVAALGDIEGEFYVGYGHRDNWYVDGIIGLRLPTGTDKDSNDSPYYMSTGHNKHTEIKLGLEAGWMPLCWMGLKVDGSYHHAFERSEQRSVAFKGSTVKNIGTLVDTDVSWDYFIGHFDWTVFHPWNTEIGATLGYEIFAKRKDNVSLKDSKATTATDLLGRTNQEIDLTILENRTNSMSHKVRGQVFHRWNLFEIFAGASHVFAGRSVMKESEAHIGFAIYF